MNEERDKRFVILALERGLVTADQVKACRQRQAEATTQPPPSILRLLVQHGYLTRDQIIELASGKNLPDLDDCDLVDDLGQGTTGTSVVLQQRSTARRYVLKVIHRALARDREFVARVHHDAAIAAKLDHPSIVPTLGSTQRMDDVVVVSDYVQGASLRDMLAAKGRLGTHEVLSVAISAATALQQAHAAGLLHGAVSPTNLLVAQDGTVKLADLGVAKPRDVEVSISRTGPLVRSPNCLPPEHFDPQAALDGRSDLFALGSVLYHCLSGRPPFSGDTTAEVIFAIRNGVCEPLGEAAPEAPAALSAIIMKLLQTDPARRYQDPSALLADLQAVQAGRVPAAQRKAIAEAHAAKAAPPPEAQAQPEAQEPPKPRHKWRWAVAAAAGAAVVAAGIGGVWHLSRPKPPAHKDKEEIGAKGPLDPIALARKGREEIEAALKAPEPKAEEPPAAKLDAVQSKIAKLQEIEKKYAGTEAAEEARKRLAPLQAEALFQSAVAEARAHPDAKEANAQRFREVMAKFASTEAAYNAESELEKIEGVERKKLRADLDAARERANALAAKRRFGEAMSQFDALLQGNPPEEIKQVILQEKIAITSEAERAYLDLHKRAQDKIGGKYYEEAKALYDQAVAAFGVEPYVSRARAEIAIIAPLLKSAAAHRLEAIDDAKFRSFLNLTEPARAFARSWDIEGSTRECEKIRADLQKVGLGLYLDSFLDDVKLLTSLKRRVIRRLSDQAAPVTVRQFSLGKVGGKFDPQWLEAKAVRADDNEVVFQYGQLEVRRAWAQFAPDELYKLGNLAIDAADPQGHLVLGIHCFYADLPTLARRELHLAKAGAPEAESYLQRVELVLGTQKAAAAAGPQEEASRLLMEAKRYMNERAWDRALLRLADLRKRHADKVFDVSANLADIDQRIIQCKRQVEKLELESNLALGKRVSLLSDILFDEWQQRFGKWTVETRVVDGKGTTVLRAENTEDHDAECLFSLRHPAAYELRVKVRVLSGTGAILRLAGKARPNVGYWLHAAKPDLVGLTYAQPTDQQADERALARFTFQPKTEYELRAVVTPAKVEVTLGEGTTGGNDYVARMPNKLPPEASGVQTYGLLVNPKSSVEFRDFSVRVLSEQ